jgi:hypothetical protein
MMACSSSITCLVIKQSPRSVAQHPALAVGRRGGALDCGETVNSFEARALNDAMIPGSVLHQPVADVTAQDISTSRS